MRLSFLIQIPILIMKPRDLIQIPKLIPIIIPNIILIFYPILIWSTIYDCNHNPYLYPKFYHDQVYNHIQ